MSALALYVLSFGPIAARVAHSRSVRVWRTYEIAYAPLLKAGRHFPWCNEMLTGYMSRCSDLMGYDPFNY
jgi:hypothetical protein